MGGPAPRQICGQAQPGARLVTWAVRSAAACSGVAFVVDVMLTSVAGWGPTYSFATGAAAGAFGVVMGVVFALPAFLVERWPRLRPVAAALIVLAAWLIAAPSSHARPLRYAGLAVGAAGLAIVLLFARRRAIAAVLGLAALAADIFIPQTVVRAAHDLAGAVALGAAVALAGPLPIRAVRETGRKNGMALLGLLVAAALVFVEVDAAAPGWRAAAWQRGRFADRLARLVRATIDFDGDDFSALAWGGDCDDWDASKNPRAQDYGNIDRNCNGIVSVSAVSELDRGLLPLVGSPKFEVPVQTALLVTIDCWRADALDSRRTPGLSILAARGLYLNRLYAGGTRTRVSVPLLLRGTAAVVSIAERLTGIGIATTAVVSIPPDAPVGDLTAGFAHVERGRFSADEVTRRASVAGPGLVWAHYYDLHDGIEPYDTALRRIDTAVTALVATLRPDLVIITGDHGEAFGEHGLQHHGVSTFDVVARVPGILIAPGLRPGRTAALLTHRDVPATLWGAFGHEDTEERFGRSWLRLRAAPAAELHSFVMIASDRAADGGDFSMPMLAIVAGRYKLSVTFEDQLAELYDLRRDPEERAPIIAAPEEPALRRMLELFRELDR